MNRRHVILSLAAVTIGPAWPQGKPRHIGVLASVHTNDPEVRSRVATFEDELLKLGWKNGSNLIIDYRFADGDSTKVVPLGRAILDQKPELVVGFSQSAAAALRQLTLSVPIVFVQVPDPVAAGFVTNLARPEGNITGFTNLDASIGAKWLEAIKECAPKVNRVAVVFDPINPAWTSYVRSVESAARNFNVVLSPIAANTPTDLERELGAFAASANGAFVILPGVGTTTHRALIISAAARHRMPAMYPYAFHAASGGLMSYGVDLPSLYRGAASYVDRILKGAKPADLPIQQPTRFEFVVNLKTAKALGMTIPTSLLQRADKILQ